MSLLNDDLTVSELNDLAIRTQQKIERSNDEIKKCKKQIVNLSKEIESLELRKTNIKSEIKKDFYQAQSQIEKEKLSNKKVLSEIHSQEVEVKNRQAALELRFKSLDEQSQVQRDKLYKMGISADDRIEKANQKESANTDKEEHLNKKEAKLIRDKKSSDQREYDLDNIAKKVAGDKKELAIARAEYAQLKQDVRQEKNMAKVDKAQALENRISAQEKLILIRQEQSALDKLKVAIEVDKKSLGKKEEQLKADNKKLTLTREELKELEADVDDKNKLLDRNRREIDRKLGILKKLRKGDK